MFTQRKNINLMPSRLLTPIALVAGFLNAGTIVTTTYIGSGGNLPDATTKIVSPGLFSSEIMALDNVSITAISILLVGLRHTFVGDLSIALVNASSGAQVFLLQQVGERAVDHNCGGNPIPGAQCSAALDGTYAFGDEFLGDLWLASSSSSIAPGDYYPTAGDGVRSALSQTFSGGDAAGLWRLIIIDSEPGDAGFLASWELRISHTAVPEPGVFGMFTAASCLCGILRIRRNLRHACTTTNANPDANGSLSGPGAGEWGSLANDCSVHDSAGEEQT